MKGLKALILILILIFSINFSYAYEKLDFFDNFHVYTPYIYITQDDTTIEKIKILVLFHDYVKPTNDKKQKEKEQEEQEEEQIIYDFAGESANWEFLAEKEKIFIMGFDFDGYDSFLDKENMDIVNKRVLMEIDRMKQTCGTKDIKVYVAGTNFGGNIALLFNLIYDNYDGAFCMNILKPTKNIEKNLEKCENKNFYFFHCNKNKDMSISKIKSLNKKLIKKGANAEFFIYEDSKNILSQEAYLDAIDKIAEQ